MKHNKISRRSFCRAALAGAAALALSSCAGQAPASAPQSQSTAATASGSSPDAPLLAAEDYPHVDGSTACIPLMAAMLHQTTGIDLTEAQSSITVSTTGYAWQAIATQYDANSSYSPRLLIVYEAPDYIQQEIEESGVALEITAIGKDALVFMVNEQNPVQSLTRQELVDIYTGKITNWQQVGGNDEEIVAFQRSEDSGSQTLFKKLLMGDVEPMQAPTALAPADMDGLVDALATYNNEGTALGFSVYYYIDQMYAQPGLRLLAVDGVLPSNETIADGSYPLPNPFYAVIRAEAAEDSPERLLYNWICGPEGKTCIAGAGYVPA